MDSFPSYFRYWGKSKTENNLYTVHLLPYHALDVAAVSSVILSSDALLRDRMAKTLQIPEHQIVPLTCFLLAIHDIGNFSTPAFQLMVPSVALSLQGAKGECLPGYHTDLGYSLWKESSPHTWG